MRSIGLRYNRIYYSPDAPGGAGGGQPGAQPGSVGMPGAQQTMTGGQQEEEPVKTPEQVMAEWNELWNPPKPAGTEGNQQQQQNNQQQQPNQNAPSDRLQSFLKEQKYFEGMDQSKFSEALRSGDPAQIMPAMNQMMSNMHSIMLANMDKFGEHYYKKAVADATSQIGSSINYDKMYDSVFTSNPALKFPAIAPMVKATIKQLVAKGKDSDTAVKETLKFFEAMGNTVNKAPPNVGGRPGSYSPSVARSQDGTKADYDALWADKDINF